MKHILMPVLATICLFSGLHESFSQVGKGNSNSVYEKARVYISIDKPVRGQADKDETIYINPDKGSYAYVIIDNYPNKFPVDNIELRAYRKVGGQYEKIKETNYDIDNNYTYTYIQYGFYTPGDYAFDVYDENGDFIGSGFVIVKDKQSNGTASTGGKYDKARVFTSIEKPVNGIAKEVKSLTINRENGSYAYIIVDNYPNDFDLNTIKLKVYKKIGGKYELLKETNYNIDGDSYFTYIKYNFYTDGDYAFDVYDGKGTFIKSGYASITYK